MTAILLPQPKQQYLSDTGTPLAGGRLYTYVAGTTTNKTTWSDAAQTSANANPVVLDARGEATIYWSGAYKVELRTAANALVWTRDNVTSLDIEILALLAASGGAALIGRTGGGTVQTFIDTVAREQLAADRTYYVRTDGSNSNTGLTNSAGGAFLTIQKAISTAYGRLDLNGFKVTIQVAAGTYTTPIFVQGTLIGTSGSNPQPLQIIGDEATPSNVVISITSSNCLTMNNSAYLLLAGVKCQTTGGGYGWFLTTNATLEHRNCVFGNVTSDMIITQAHSTVRALGPTTVAGNALSFCHATKRSIIDFSAQTITFTAVPVFSTYIWGVNDSAVNLDSGTIIGTASGGIVVHDHGILNASSLTGSYTGTTAALVDDGGLIAVADLAVARTYYVRTDGNDANDGLVNTAGRAFRNIQTAIDAVAKKEYNPITWAANSGVLINVAAGTYTETVKFRDMPYVNATLRGDLTTPGNVIIAGTSDGVTAIAIGSKWALEGFKITAAAGAGLRVEQGSQVTFQKIDFGAATGQHILALTNALVIAAGAYSITAATTYHIFARGAQVDISGVTVTLTGTPALSRFAYAALGGTIRAVSSVFSGAATGTRYEVISNGVIDTNGGGAAFLPGNVAGSTATGGQYV